MSATTEPTEATANPEAERIMLLAQIASLRQERDALSDADPWAPDRGPLHARYAEALQEEREADRRLYRLGPPETPAGVRLAAHVAWDVIADHLRHSGVVRCEDFGDWLIIAVLQGLTGIREETTAGETLRYWLSDDEEVEAEDGTSTEAMAEAGT